MFTHMVFFKLFFKIKTWHWALSMNPLQTQEVKSRAWNL